MLCLGSLNNALNYIHERELRLIHDDHVESFQYILELTNEKTIYQKNLECLVKESCKFLHGLPPPTMNDFFQIRENFYNPENFQVLYSSNKK